MMRSVYARVWWTRGLEVGRNMGKDFSWSYRRLENTWSDKTQGIEYIRPRTVLRSFFFLFTQLFVHILLRYTHTHTLSHAYALSISTHHTKSWTPSRPFVRKTVRRWHNMNPLVSYRKNYTHSFSIHSLLRNTCW